MCGRSLLLLHLGLAPRPLREDDGDLVQDRQHDVPLLRPPDLPAQQQPGQHRLEGLGQPLGPVLAVHDHHGPCEEHLPHQQHCHKAGLSVLITLLSLLLRQSQKPVR